LGQDIRGFETYKRYGKSLTYSFLVLQYNDQKIKKSKNVREVPLSHSGQTLSLSGRTNVIPDWLSNVPSALFRPSVAI
jgi:hypothetical protein